MSISAAAGCSRSPRARSTSVRPCAALLAAGPPSDPPRYPATSSSISSATVSSGTRSSPWAWSACAAEESSYVYYLRRFVAPIARGRSPVLVFEGLDCDARVLLNGRLVARDPEHAHRASRARRRGIARWCRERARRRVLAGACAAGGCSGGTRRVSTLRAAATSRCTSARLPTCSAGTSCPALCPPGSGGGYAAIPAPERIESLWLDTKRIDAGGASAMLALHYEVAVPRRRRIGQLVITGHCGGSLFDPDQHCCSVPG